MQYVLPKRRWTSNWLYGVTFQTKVIFIITRVRTSYVTIIYQIDTNWRYQLGGVVTAKLEEGVCCFVSYLCEPYCPNSHCLLEVISWCGVVTAKLEEGVCCFVSELCEPYCPNSHCLLCMVSLVSLLCATRVRYKLGTLCYILQQFLTETVN
jgi:hypothetical protein